MKWFNEVFLKSLMENQKCRDISIDERLKKTICISAKQVDICIKYMTRVAKIKMYEWQGDRYYFEHEVNGIKFRLDIQKRGYGILVMYQ